jgi:hypothetical protein
VVDVSGMALIVGGKVPLVMGLKEAAMPILVVLLGVPRLSVGVTNTEVRADQSWVYDCASVGKGSIDGWRCRVEAAPGEVVGVVARVDEGFVVGFVAVRPSWVDNL